MVCKIEGVEIFKNLVVFEEFDGLMALWMEE